MNWVFHREAALFRLAELDFGIFLRAAALSLVIRAP
jgi:hypothetical protein